jgi:hypothetical protein
MNFVAEILYSCCCCWLENLLSYIWAVVVVCGREREGLDFADVRGLLRRRSFRLLLCKTRLCTLQDVPFALICFVVCGFI